MADIPNTSIEYESSTHEASTGGEMDGRTSCQSTPDLMFTPPSSSSSHSKTGPIDLRDDEQRINGRLTRNDFERVMTPPQQGSPGLMDMTAVSAVLDMADQEHVRGASLSGDGRERRESTPRGTSGRSSSNTPLNRHDVASEDPPKDAFNKPSFQNAIRDISSAVSNIATVLESGYHHRDPGSTVNHLHEKARALAEFQCPNIRTVGFVGDSGVGKHRCLPSCNDEFYLMSLGLR